MKITVGCDIVLISRFNPDNDRFNERFLSKNELLKLEKLTTPFLKRQFLASCWAVKESVFKATQLKFDFAHFSIINDLGEFQFEVNFQNFYISFSISEEGDNCVAFCIAQKEKI
ncbi:4'-phosphopantetheinyl transferase superfamily protein [Mycoplasma sp. SG1]|uniref:4'-phosphopantetheinyl transferase superfamily protein n=1 Tax=Mycoplasma sp. SG1 TaxID=2810348 RepID=UPI002025B210|nr:4'-phosphopantetheinyl transferase superfamily protein [Mycoplasma sp. SG1]URM53039.1 4'-phosphopantetheinyl transferase superfamily protein [Mycoplasma sp. SG1]